MTNDHALGRAVLRWWPSALIMLAIFGLSSRPTHTLPDLGWADTLVKKGGHVIGYFALAITYWRGLAWKPGAAWLAFALAVACGLTDEFHQLYVAGRQASLADVVLFDAPGALAGLLCVRHLRRRRSTEVGHLDVTVG